MGSKDAELSAGCGELEDFPTVCTDPPRATRRVKRTLAYNTEYLYQYKGYGYSDH
jgi:hypothetical protein